MVAVKVDRTQPEILVRRDVAQAVFNHFNGKPLDWKNHDCGRLAGMALRLMGQNPQMSRFTGYSNEIGARRKLVAAGFKDLPAVLDDMALERIPPVFARMADIVGWPGEGGWTALAVQLNGGNQLMFAMDGICRPFVPPVDTLNHAIAWRVPVKGGH